MSFSIFLQEMLVLYIIGLIGFFARKKDILNQHATQVLTQLILNLTLPFLILYAMGQPYVSGVTGKVFWLIPISFLILSSAIILTFLLRKVLQLPDDRRRVLEGLVIFGNQGFIGFALLSSLFPEHGPLFVSIFNLPYLLLIWTYGVYLFVGNKGNIPWRKIFLNPGILATLIGILIFMLPIHWPVMLSALFNIVGNTTIPLSMLLIGALLANMQLKQSLVLLKDKTMWLVTGLRLIILPLLLLPIIFFSLPFPLAATAILVTATPAAPTIALYSQTYGGDTDYAAFGSAWTTLLSAFTIPMLYILLLTCYHIIH
ncbi:AEC family transporter [Oceanobacillus luteolus]|uniref:AEC family transporter n=1 Tax=Oceanobacillus luteolus TaxID=1274358 RepID=UPI00203E01AB|nr:AEC family transporter [Oceanobacillus luteolus]MCM3741327.1 AEC family transporter [Oceanobacillus luteolus]